MAVQYYVDRGVRLLREAAIMVPGDQSEFSSGTRHGGYQGPLSSGPRRCRRRVDGAQLLDGEQAVETRRLQRKRSGICLW
jgi:hypothetical protein